MSSGTEACPTGRTTLLILRCDTDTTSATTTAGTAAGSVVGVKAELSPRCAVGTCDGCQFVVMMRSPAGCHVCTRRDFHTYKTLCINGRRRVITDMIT